MKILLFPLTFLIFSLGVVFADPVTTEVSSEIKTHFVDEQIMVMADISNNQDRPQNFAYITQIKNDDDIVISLSWLTGSLSPRQSFSPAQSWTPSESGVYRIQVFVWEGIDHPEALSSPLSMSVSVNEKKS